MSFNSTQFLNYLSKSVSTDSFDEFIQLCQKYLSPDTIGVYVAWGSILLLYVIMIRYLLPSRQVSRKLPTANLCNHNHNHNHNYGYNLNPNHVKPSNLQIQHQSDYVPLVSPPTNLEQTYDIPPPSKIPIKYKTNYVQSLSPPIPTSMPINFKLQDCLTFVEHKKHKSVYTGTIVEKVFLSKNLPPKIDIIITCTPIENSQYGLLYQIIYFKSTSNYDVYKTDGFSLYLQKANIRQFGSDRPEQLYLYMNIA